MDKIETKEILIKQLEVIQKRALSEWFLELSLINLRSSMSQILV